MANNSMQRTALRAAADAARSPRPSSHLHPSRLSAASNYGQLPIINNLRLLPILVKIASTK
jgi:hypothetical protein